MVRCESRQPDVTETASPTPSAGSVQAEKGDVAFRPSRTQARRKFKGPFLRITRTDLACLQRGMLRFAKRRQPIFDVAREVVACHWTKRWKPSARASISQES
jgi:hypothetical protein